MLRIIALMLGLAAIPIMPEVANAVTNRCPVSGKVCRQTGDGSPTFCARGVCYSSKRSAEESCSYDPQKDCETEAPASNRGASNTSSCLSVYDRQMDGSYCIVTYINNCNQTLRCSAGGATVSFFAGRTGGWRQHMSCDLEPTCEVSR